MVTLLQLSSWSPGELPHPTSILSLVELLSKTQRNSPSRHTTIICRSVSLSNIMLLNFLIPTHPYPAMEGEGRYLSISAFSGYSLFVIRKISLSPLSPYPVMEWGGQGHSSVSILSWRDSRQRVWWTSSRLSSLLVSRELALSLMLYVPLHYCHFVFLFYRIPSLVLI